MPDGCLLKDPKSNQHFFTETLNPQCVTVGTLLIQYKIKFKNTGFNKNSRKVCF